MVGGGCGLSACASAMCALPMMRRMEGGVQVAPEVLPFYSACWPCLLGLSFGCGTPDTYLRAIPHALLWLLKQPH